MTALELTTVPAEEPSTRLSSPALEETAVPPISNDVPALIVCTSSFQVPSDARMDAVPPVTSEDVVIS